MTRSRDGGSHRGTFLHGGLLFSLAVATIVAWGVVAPTDPGSGLTVAERFELLLYGLLGSLFMVIPLLAGITIGVSRVERGLVSTAAAITVAAVALMVTIDILAPPTAPALNQPAVQGDVTIELRAPPARLEEGGIRTLIGFIWGGRDEAGEILRSYPEGHPRLTLVKGLLAFLLLFLPPVFVGVNLGVTTWISESVSFRTEKKERIARLFLSWALTPLFFSLVMFFSSRTQAAVLFRGQSPLLILVPAMPLLFLAWLGWSSAASAVKRLEELEPKEDLVSVEAMPIEDSGGFAQGED